MKGSGKWKVESGKKKQKTKKRQKQYKDSGKEKRKGLRTDIRFQMSVKEVCSEQ